MRTIVVEGWRLIPHSYAMVSQYMCLELLKRSSELVLYHQDVPFCVPRWTRDASMWASDVAARIAVIPPPQPALRPDAVLRMGFPLFLEADPAAGRTFCWGTSEFGLVDSTAIGGGRSPLAALSNATAHIVTCSNWAAKGFINSGALASNVSVVPCGIDPNIFFPAKPEVRAALRRRFGWESKFVVLNISAMTPNKGIHLAMRALAGLVDEHPDLVLMLKGSDALYQSGQFAARYFSSLTPTEASKLETRIQYVGPTLSAAGIAELYQAADVYLSPYRAEGFNLPVLEAAACGLPVICTRGGSTEDFVDDSFALRVNSSLAVSEAGNMTLEPDADHLRQQLQRVVTDSGFRELARLAGPSWAHSKFTWAHSVDKLMAVMFPD